MLLQFHKTLRPAGKINFVFCADPGLVDSFQRSFTWLWAQARDLLADGLPAIPELVLPEGSEEAARRWETFCYACLPGIENDEMPPETAQIDPETGAVSLVSRDNKTVIPPGEEVGLPQLDLLTDFLVRLYAKGMVVTIDKLSRIPPLDAPLNPAWFGDTTEIQRGNVRRKVSMRVSLIDEKTLKQIDKRRNALRVLLTKLSFGLADNVRWMPQAAQSLFETEIQRVNAEGQQLIADVLKGDVAAFIQGKRTALVADLTAMSREVGWQGEVPADAIAKVMESLTDRLTKAQAANFMPKLTYSPLHFGRTSNTWASPWGQAYALLSDIAAFPRKALTDFYFLRGLRVPTADVIEAMNVADDALLRAQATLTTRERCQVELDLLTRIEKAPLDPKEKRAFLWRIIEGDDPGAIAAVLESQENDQH